MAVISAVVSDKLYKDLSFSAKKLKRSKSFLIGEALSQYIQDLMEDIEDIKDAERILAQNEPAISFDEMMSRLGLNKD